MNINSTYAQNVEAMRQLKMPDSFYEVREPYKEGFKEIYNNAKNENVTMSTAKDFLNSLSKEELSTLQNYSLLVDDINVNSLNDEGAYNLLLNHYEKYDFNNDGIVSTGIGKGLPLLPTNMPPKEKEAMVKTLNEMNEKDRFSSLMMLNLPTFTLGKDGTISAQNNNETMDYEAIMKRVDQILNPRPPAYTSSELKNSFALFKDIFERNFDEYSEHNEQNRIIKNREAQLLKAKISAV